MTYRPSEKVRVAVLATLRELIEAGAETPTCEEIAEQTDFTRQPIERTIRYLAKTGEIIITGPNNHTRSFAMPGVQGETYPRERLARTEIVDIDELENVNRRFVARLKMYFENHRAEHMKILGVVG